MENEYTRNALAQDDLCEKLAEEREAWTKSPDPRCNRFKGPSRRRFPSNCGKYIEMFKPSKDGLLILHWSRGFQESNPATSSEHQ